MVSSLTEQRNGRAAFRELRGARPRGDHDPGERVTRDRHRRKKGRRRTAARGGPTGDDEGRGADTEDVQQPVATWPAT